MARLFNKNIHVKIVYTAFLLTVGFKDTFKNWMTTYVRSCAMKLMGHVGKSMKLASA